MTPTKTTSEAVGTYGTYRLNTEVNYNTAQYGWLDGHVTHIGYDEYHRVALVRVELVHQERIIALVLRADSLDLVPADYWDIRAKRMMS